MITKKEFAAMQDHAIVEPFADEKAIRARIQETLDYGFASIVVNPCWVKFTKEIVGNRNRVSTLIAFPFGAATTKMKIAEALEAIDNGADDLDFVINLSWIKSGYFDRAEAELKEIVKAVKGKRKDVSVKVIIECCYLTHDEKVKSCEVVVNSGADYVKTSTGTGKWGCRIGDVRLMKKVVGDRCKIKAAADIRNIEDALAVIEAGATRIGENSAVEMMRDWDKQLWY